MLRCCWSKIQKLWVFLCTLQSRICLCRNNPTRLKASSAVSLRSSLFRDVVWRWLEVGNKLLTAPCNIPEEVGPPRLFLSNGRELCLWTKCVHNTIHTMVQTSVFTIIIQPSSYVCNIYRCLYVQYTVRFMNSSVNRMQFFHLNGLKGEWWEQNILSLCPLSIFILAQSV